MTPTPHTDLHAARAPSQQEGGRYAGSRALYERARRIIPGGTHLSGRPLVDAETTPMYFDRAQGCRIWDVDGHAYIDYLMAFGAYLLGYAHPEVEAAAFAQAQKGRLVSLNHPQHIAFIEALLPRFPGAQMGTFFRTGSEATTAALRIARRATGRRRVARCGYHGWHDWCLPREDFVPAGLDEQVPEWSARDPETLAALLRAAPDQIAAVILAPEMVTPFHPETFTRIARLTRAHGAVLILDEVKTGFRIAPGSVSARVGIVPDLITVSKALGNGFAVAALLGREEVMRFGAGMHYSATFHGDTAAMAAAHKTLELIDRHDVQAHVHALGEQLITGLNERSRALGIPAEAYGEPLPPMPFFRFTHPDPRVNERLTETFYREVLARGVLLHPRHLWFISYAHKETHIEETLRVAGAALDVARRALR